MISRPSLVSSPVVAIARRDLAAAAGSGSLSPGVAATADQIVKLKVAQEEFLSLDQATVDRIFEAVAHEAAKQRVPLALSAVAESRMGAFEDKVIKNSLACELPLSRYRNAKTVGVIERDSVLGQIKIAVPKGPVAGILP